MLDLIRCAADTWVHCLPKSRGNDLDSPVNRNVRPRMASNQSTLIRSSVQQTLLRTKTWVARLMPEGHE